MNNFSENTFVFNVQIHNNTHIYVFSPGKNNNIRPWVIISKHFSTHNRALSHTLALILTLSPSFPLEFEAIGSYPFIWRTANFRCTGFDSTLFQQHKLLIYIYKSYIFTYIYVYISFYFTILIQSQLSRNALLRVHTGVYLYAAFVCQQKLNIV